MAKKNKKLLLKKETVRDLAAEEMGKAGGAATFGCNYAYTDTSCPTVGTIRSGVSLSINTGTAYCTITQVGCIKY